MADSATVTLRDEDVPSPGQSSAVSDPAAEVIEVRLPAGNSYVSLLRTVTASLAARARFTVDEIEDLRIAVDEACAMLVSQATRGSQLSCSFLLASDALEFTVTVPTTSGVVPARDTFGWIVLSSLAGGADAGLEHGALWIRLHKQRQHTPEPETAAGEADSPTGDTP